MGIQAKKNVNIAYRLLWLFLLVGIGLWAWEVNRSLAELALRRENHLNVHQHNILDGKAEELRSLFQTMYQSARTISLLPMVREVRGENRHDTGEDVVAQGRFPVDAHRTLQQIYANLATNVQVSEVYFVLDGFEPIRHIPFFMYDNQIVGIPEKTSSLLAIPDSDITDEREDEEYSHFPVQLEWFRRNAPEFLWFDNLNGIPVRLSPALRTCDNSQYLSLANDDERDTFGIIFAFPVYAEDTDHFIGMITIILRTNVLESLLIGVPYLPLTGVDLVRQKEEGWLMPAPVSFRLKAPEYGIDIYDRRSSHHTAASPRGPDSREAAVRLDLGTGRPWTLSHILGPQEIEALSATFSRERSWLLFGRLTLLFAMLGTLGWASFMLRGSYRELNKLANFDPLTTLPNRRLFFYSLNYAIHRAARSKRRVALFIIDIFNFKLINDTYGHRSGDVLLTEIASRIQGSLRDTDTIARRTSQAPYNGLASRLGGDEFTVICEDFHSTDDIHRVAERLLRTLHSPFQLEGDEIRLTASIGIALYPDDAREGEKLLARADTAMHEGRRREAGYFIFNDELRKHSERMSVLSLELSEALHRQQFRLFYQPKASLKDGHVVSLEALLRWDHPALGSISPLEFIPLLEGTGGIIPVGEWVIEQACRDLRLLDEAGFDELRVSVNISVRQLRLPDLDKTIARVLRQTGTAAHRLILEITESMVIENFEEGRQVLLRLKELGTPIAIDDFGTGYSSMTYLQHLPLDYLKLDKGFIDGMDHPKAKHIIKTIIDLARGLSMQTIAEGIETVEQRDRLAAFGCDIMQGYLLSKALPLAEIVDWLLAAHENLPKCTADDAATDGF